MAHFSIDNVEYPNVYVRTPIKRKAIVKDGENSGFLLTGEYFRDLVGTYYDYSMVLDLTRASTAEYTALYQVLTAPTEYHTIIVPYNQTTLQYKAYVEEVSDELIKVIGGTKYWRNLNVTFFGAEPARV